VTFKGVITDYKVSSAFGMATDSLFFMLLFPASSSAMAERVRDRAKLASFSINVKLYSQNHKIAFLSHPMGASRAI